jgi:hypothetical protein
LNPPVFVIVPPVGKLGVKVTLLPIQKFDVPEIVGTVGPAPASTITVTD